MEKYIYINYNSKIDKLILIDSKNSDICDEFKRPMIYLKVARKLYNFKLLFTLVIILTILLAIDLFLQFIDFNSIFFNIIIFIQYITVLMYLYYSIFKVNM